jgi:hypothetical protein
MENSHKQGFHDLEGELKEFYEFHGVQLMSIGFPPRRDLLARLYEKLRAKQFDAGKYLKIIEN